MCHLSEQEWLSKGAHVPRWKCHGSAAGGGKRLVSCQIVETLTQPVVMCPILVFFVHLCDYELCI